jgi:hypothetical protein
MFRKHHAVKHVAGGIAIVAVVAAIAVQSAAAGTSMRRAAESQACQAGAPGWISITDDLGVPSLQPVAPTACTDTVACTSTYVAATRSPYPGWVFVTDDLGLQSLYPAVMFDAVSTQTCDNVLAARATGVTTVQTVDTPPRPVLQSPYPGWVFVIDDLGIPYLEPISDLRS